MPSSESARPEQTVQPVINLASLPRDEAIYCARIAAREILGDEDAVRVVADTLCMNWLNQNMPIAVGQSDDEFGELMDAVTNEFYEGLTEGVKRFAENNRTVERTEDFLNSESRLAWKVHNILVFMREAMDDDASDGLPVKCTVVDLCADVEKLATSLMDLVWRARRA